MLDDPYGSETPRSPDGEQRADLPPEILRLAPRMQQIATIVYRRGAVSVRQIQQAIDDDLTIYGIRTLLGRMVRRGLIKRRPSGRHAEVIYLPALLTPEVRAMALGQLIANEFEGSAKSALIAAMRLAQSSSGKVPS